MLAPSLLHAESIKDIVHNVKEFESSSTDVKLRLYKLIKGELNGFYLNMYHLINKQSTYTHFESLAELVKTNQRIYNFIQKEIYKQAGARTLNDIEITNLLNVCKHIFFANDVLIKGMKDIILTPEEVRDFNKIPEL